MSKATSSTKKVFWPTACRSPVGFLPYWRAVAQKSRVIGTISSRGQPGPASRSRRWRFVGPLAQTVVAASVMVGKSTGCYPMLEALTPINIARTLMSKGCFPQFHRSCAWIGGQVREPFMHCSGVGKEQHSFFAAFVTQHEEAKA